MPTNQPRPRIAPWKIKLTLLLGSSLFCLLLLEAGVRTVGIVRSPWTPPADQTFHALQNDSILFTTRVFHHTFIPGAKFTKKSEHFAVRYEINAHGFRGPALDEQAPAGMKRMVIVGDSMVEGWGVEFDESFPTLVGQALEPYGWATLNAGILRVGPAYFAANLPRYLAMHPDMLVIVLYDNDLRDDIESETRYDQLAGVWDLGRLVQGRTGHPTPLSHLAALLGTTTKLSGPQEPAALTTLRENHQAKNPLHAPKALATIKDFTLPETQQTDAWAITKDYLNYIRETLDAEQIPLCIVRLSYAFCRTDPDWEFFYFAARFDNDTAQWATNIGVPYINATPLIETTWAANNKPAILFGEDDAHPNALGHRLTAEALVPLLEDVLNKTKTQKSSEK